MLALVASNVSRRYGVHRALAEATLRFAGGEVTAIVGGNGAGKSTLLKVLGGVLSPTTGGVTLNGRDVGSVRSAMLLGIGFCHQEVSLVPDWTIAEHFTAPRRPARVEPWRLLAPELSRASIIRDLSPHQQQCLEVSRALSSGSVAILLDEPTALLGALEKRRTLDTMRELAVAGRVVVWVTHDLPGALEYANRIVILREGHVVNDALPATLTIATILEAMGGATPRPPASSVSPSTRHEEADCGASNGAIELDLGRRRTIVGRPGEIVGIAGSARSGAPELLRGTVGLSAWPGLTVRFGGVAAERTLAGARRAGVGYMSRERSTEWLFERQSVAFNVAAGSFRQLGDGVALTQRRLDVFAQQWADRFDVKAPSLRMDIEGLSGGNRQKAVLARLASTRPSVMLLDEPFSGVDRPTRTRLFDLLRGTARDGAAILVYSQESADLLDCTDRVHVVTPDAMRTFESGETDASDVERAVLEEQGRVA